jgi:primosomal protein N' (replication factor Y)
LRVSVALAGPWWNSLTYLAPEKYPEGVRVRVPVGNGVRVGLVLEGPTEEAYGGELREITGAIDQNPLLPPFAMPLLRWFSETYICGIGTAMKTLLPASFLQGCPPDPEGLPVPREIASKNCDAANHFLYEPVDTVRFERYAEILSDGRPSLICFPLYDTAKAFAGFMGGRVFLYPRSGAKAEWRAWNQLASEGGIAVGGQTAAVAPLPGLARIIVEDESNNAWRTLRPPLFNVRSLLAKRAMIEGASLVLGGRMPSSRAYMTQKKTSAPGPSPQLSSGHYGYGRKNFLFVDLRLAYSPSVKGVQDSLAVSEPLVRETETAIGRGSWAIWILDRKGYAGEIVCGECGSSLRCAKCGGAMRWEAASGCLSCVACGAREPIPISCPACSGRLLTARRPGLEALLPLAKSALTCPVLPLADGEAASVAAALKSRPCLVIGTRAALSVCDVADVGLVGWIDADGEARSREYDARARAFGLIWESRWRGTLKKPNGRLVLLQTRSPGKDWQMGLAADGPNRPGWSFFWQGELKDRREFSMPPFMSLVKIEVSAQDAKALAERFDEARFEYWLAESQDSKKDSRKDPKNDSTKDSKNQPQPQDAAGAPEKSNPSNIRATIWLRTNSLSALRGVLSPFFSIGRARRGYPSITIRHE